MGRGRKRRKHNNANNRSASTNPQSTTTTTRQAFIVNGAGNKPVPITLKESGDTVETVVERAGITLAKDKMVTLGKRPVSDPKTTPVGNGDTLVIASKVANGLASFF